MKAKNEKHEKKETRKKKSSNKFLIPVIIIIALIIIGVGVMLLMDYMKTKALLKESEKLFQEKNYELSAKKINEYIKKKPNDKKAYLLIYKILTATGEDDKAYAVLEKLGKIAPKDCDIKIKLARFYITRGQNEKAKEALNAALKLNPKDPEIYHLMGLIYVEEQNPDKAYETYKEILKFDPDANEKNKKAIIVAYKALLEIIGNQGRIDKEALSVITKAIKFLPEEDKGRAYIALGNYYYKQEKWDSALKRYQIALKKSPEDEIWANVVVADIYEKKGDKKKALDYYRKVYEFFKDPKHVNPKNLSRISIYAGIKKNELKLEELKEKVRELENE